MTMYWKFKGLSPDSKMVSSDVAGAEKTANARQGKPTPEQLEAIGRELDALRQEVIADLGQRDADYIRDMIRRQRWTEISGRTLIHFSLNPITWAVGVGLLTTAKILENMEIGHNVMHGQYDWMNDPDLQSQTYEWDNVCDGDSWRKTHNYEHHTYTNIINKDRDFGYAILRLSNDTPWRVRNLFQFSYYIALSSLFEYGVGIHELEVERLENKEVTWKEKIPFIKNFSKKITKQVVKDYVVFPALAGPFAPKVFAGNLLANLGRNLWASSIIFCGHFTENVQTFTEEECEDESRGHWYYRQMLGSSNFTGGRWLHVMSGNLSYQIEHHLFPDLPAHRYAELSPKVEAICKKYGLHYNTGTFGEQFSGVMKRILRYSLPPSLEAMLPRKTPAAA